jgi:hypothetical protein
VRACGDGRLPRACSGLHYDVSPNPLGHDAFELEGLYVLSGDGFEQILEASEILCASWRKLLDRDVGRMSVAGLRCRGCFIEKVRSVLSSAPGDLSSTCRIGGRSAHGAKGESRIGECTAPARSDRKKEYT